MGWWGDREFWDCLDFRGDMIYPKDTNMGTKNTSDKEEEAVAIITDAGSH